ncbi:hypothetical protein DH2020_033833 [Rehmannia glutinosa]|uniref:VPS9 domain-containing protein n=1 Tax=Rehmannia glutinosa TaxID=99300 RepID=A0ABR0VDW5_REHGL
MENSDVFSSSTAPLTWHDFLERMRHPSSVDFVKAIKRKRQCSRAGVFGNMEAAFRAHSLWAGSSEEELESVGEGLEKHIMTKLFTRVFASMAEDVKADEQLHEKMALIQQFIRPENLDIKLTFQNETSWLLAQKELQKINMYKAPRDKLVCILNCCKVISNLLINASLASNEDHPGADEFLPVLIYVTIKTNPPRLHSNLSYIQRFRRQTYLVAEAAYFFTNMLSVESFIMNIDAKALSMDETEFEKNMESARTLLSGLSEISDTQSQQDQKFEHVSVQSSETKSQNDEQYGKNQSSINKIPSISDLENKGASMLLKENEASQVFRDFPFLYSQAGDLTVGDVEDLLNNYKQLVFKYVSLTKGLGVKIPSPSLSKAQCQNSEQPEFAKEPEMREAHLTDNTGNYGEVSVFRLENSESKMPEEKNSHVNCKAKKKTNIPFV